MVEAARLKKRLDDEKQKEERKREIKKMEEAVEKERLEKARAIFEASERRRVQQQEQARDWKNINCCVDGHVSCQK